LNETRVRAGSAAQARVFATRSLLAALLCCRFAYSQTRESVPTNFKNDEAVERAKAGAMSEVNAAWWGFDPVDATRAIQAAIRTRAPKVIVPYVGKSWVVGPLTLVSNQELIFEPGVVVMAKEGAFRGIRDCLISGDEVTNVTIRGYHATLRMRKADYTRGDYATSEWRHVISLRGASDIRLLGLTLESSGGDGVYIGPTEDDRRIACRKVTIEDCVCKDNHRQGISVISAEDLTIANCTFSGTKGTAPQAGIDLEPSHPRDLMVNIEVRNCRALGNSGSGFMTNLERLTAQSTPVSIRIEDCLVRDSRQPGLRALLATADGPNGFVEFKNCVTESVEYSGVRCLWNTGSPIELRFVDCKWRDVARRASEAPVDLELSGRATGGSPGGIRFDNCYVYDDQDRPPIKAVFASETNAIERVSGTIFVMIGQPEQTSGNLSLGIPGLRVEPKTHK
jgi:parallel beta-helix repeat protein